MHRKLLRTIAILLMLFLLVPLTSGLANAADPPSLSQAYFTVNASAGTQKVTVKNPSGSISVSTDSPGWLSGSASGNTITVRYQANNNAMARSGTLTVSVGTKKLFIFVKQVRKLSVKNRNTGSATSQITLIGYPANDVVYYDVVGAGTISAKKDKDWMRVEVSSSAVKVYALNNFSGAERRGTVTISDGYNQFKLTVIQKMYKPSIYYDFGFMFSLQPVTSSMKTAYRELSNQWIQMNAFNEKLRVKAENLEAETMKYLGYTDTYNFPKIVFANTQEMKSKYEISNAENVYGQYRSKENIILININTNKNIAELTDTILHETRHYWQNRYGSYNSSREKYLIRYGLVYYDNSGDAGQIAEVDARTFAKKVIEMLIKY